MSERDIFDAAREMTDPAARSAYLDGACGGDAGLRSRVDALLRAHDGTDSLLDQPTFAPRDHDPANARTIALGGGETDHDEVPLGFLSPGTRADSLGRIGHYEVLQVLGQGGFGIVFRAFDDVLHRVVAVKVLSPQMAATSPARKRFLREARSSAQVRHENVVQVYEVGEEPLPYIAMEFIPGETLQQRLDRTGPIDVLEVVRIGRQIAEGLAAAHATDLIHRDIKPGNILLEGGQLRVKLTDFGLARAADDASISQSGIIAGTPMYMAPEQAKGETLDQRADLFSLGSVLYVMASGRPPFRATGMVAVLKRVAEDTPRPIREIIPETPQWLCDIIAKLHAKDPDERFQSAREVADVLADCEAQLKANSRLRDFSRIPRGKPAEGRFRRGNWHNILPILGGIFVVGIILWTRLVPREDSAVRPSSTPVVGAAGGDTKPDATADDKARIQGRWRMVALEQNGKPVPVGEHLFGYRVEFIGDTSVTYAPDGTPKYAPFVLNPGADPKEFNVLAPREGPIRHIYRFDGDKLIFALGGPGQPRPTGFKTTPDTSFSVATSVRDTDPMPGQIDWVPLFNGKDLTGWKIHPDQGGQWEVKDGLLTGSSRQSYLFSERGDYANFHLRAEAKINQGGDSGIFFRAPYAIQSGPLPWQHGPAGRYEAELQKTPTHPYRTGSVSELRVGERPNSLGRTADDSLTQPDQWFTLEIIAQQNHFITKVNGQETANCSDPLNKYPTGHLGLQVANSNTTVQFRKIEIKELTPSASPLPTTYTNSLGMEFVVVPKGRSWLGGGKDRLGDREVEIPADFYLGKYEVTQEEWERVMGENPSWFSRTGPGKDAAKDITDADLKRFPVEAVSWDQCQLFVAKLNKLEKEPGWVYRLPMEKEWEYACRGGPMADKADSAFDFYLARPTDTLLREQASFGPDNPLQRTCKVGDYQPNRLGLHGMHGNACEWCLDEISGEPKDGQPAASRRAFRGGSWQDGLDGCGAAHRFMGPPSDRGPGLGLRLARVPSGDPSPEVSTPPHAFAPFTDADVKRIAALPAAEQVEEVRKELVRRNPDFDGKVETKIEGGVVTEIKFVTDKVTDIAPIRAFNALRVLDLNGTWTGSRNGLLADLTPLKGMNLAGLTQLNLGCTKVTDAGMVYFKDCKDLTGLYLDGTKVTDKGVAHVKDCKNLAALRLDTTQVGDEGLIYFQDCKDLTYLNLSWSKVTDAGLAHFKGCKNLEKLFLGRTQVGDVGLAQFKAMPLRALGIDATGITDLTPLQGMALEEFRLTPRKITKGLNILRDMKSLKTIAVDTSEPWPAVEFWERYDKGEFGKAFTDADAQRIAALPAAEQVEEVRKELMRRNPGFDGKVEHKIEDGVVTEFKIVTDKVTDIAPIRAFTALRVLDCSGTPTPDWRGTGQLADLTPLKGMNLTGLTHLKLGWTKVDDASMVYFKDCKGLMSLILSGTQVTDTGLAHFKDCKDLTELGLDGTKVGDAGLACFEDCKKLTLLYLHVTNVGDAGLAHFKDCEDLSHLWLGSTRVSDAGLAHFKECKDLTQLVLDSTKVSDAGLAYFKDCKNLTLLRIENTKVTDLSLLKGMPLKGLICDFQPERDAEILRSLKTLETINGKPAAEFWKEVEKK